MPKPMPPHDHHAPIIAAILSSYQRYRPTHYIEIGVDRGQTVQTVAPFVDSGHAVDITFDNLLKPLPLWFTEYKMTSDQFFAENSTHAIADVVFIDGDHSASQVQKDVINALSVITGDGTVIVHDTIPLEWSDNAHCGDGYLFIQKLRLKQPNLQIWTLPLFPGLTLISNEYRPLS